MKRFIRAAVGLGTVVSDIVVGRGASSQTENLLCGAARSLQVL
jgi:hypothetical protein